VVYRLLSGHALTCQSPAKLALANAYNYTKTGSCFQHRPSSKQLHVRRLGIVFQPMKRNQPEVRSHQNCESSLAVYAPVAIKISTMLSRRNDRAILVRGREIRPKPCQGRATEFTPSRYPGSANRHKWQSETSTTSCSNSFKHDSINISNPRANTE